MSSDANSTETSITFDKESYKFCEHPILTVTDPTINSENDVTLSNIDTVGVRLWSSVDNGGLWVTLRETSPSSGIFKETIGWTDDEFSLRLRVEEGGTISAGYNDLIATSMITHEPVDPIKKVHVSNTTIFYFNELSQFPGPPIVRSNLENKQCTTIQPFVYIVQVKNADGYTVFLSWIKSILGKNQSVEAAIQWMPKTAGDFTVEIFVWDSLLNPQPLSEVSRMEIKIQ